MVACDFDAAGFKDSLAFTFEVHVTLFQSDLSFLPCQVWMLL
jgi:hypothetical protein